MKKKFYLSLKLKLLFVTTFLIGLISVFIYYYFPFQFEKEQQSSLQDKSNSITHITASSVSSGLFFDDFDAIVEEIEILIESEKINYAVILKGDSIFYEYNSQVAKSVDYLILEGVSNPSIKGIMRSYAPISIDGEKIGDIYIGFPLLKVYSKIGELKDNIRWVSIALFLIGALGVFLIGHIFTKPLSQFVNTVHKVTDGDLNQRVNISSNDEVGFLAESFNAMVDKISQGNEEMDTINKELEKRVNDRTRELEGALSSLQRENVHRKKAELEIGKSLHEKEVLLKEIHHRVKNNLQIVSSLFFFQSKQVTDPKVLDMFRDGQNRVKSMALIHEKLYQSGDLANIDFKEYIKKLANTLFQSYSVNQSKIKLKLNVQDVEIGVDTAVPCGLIINELISNTLKHAFY